MTPQKIQWQILDKAGEFIKLLKNHNNRILFKIKKEILF